MNDQNPEATTAHPPTHSKAGPSMSGYFNGCICPECKHLGAKYRFEGNHEAYEAGKTRKPPLFVKGDRTMPFDHEDKRHGTIGAYTQGCRCPKCYQAGVDYRAKKKAEKR